MRLLTLAFGLAVLLGAAGAASGVILLELGDPARNTTTPGDNSGWQYEGEFGGFLGTPIAPHFFITAKHIGGEIGQPFTFHGVTYLTTAVFPDPESDLQIWQVDNAFPVYAPLYQGAGTEPGQELHVFGRGTQRGAAYPPDSTGADVRGWSWGPGDGVPRWGRNIVSTIASAGNWPFLLAAFDHPGLPGEAHLSVGDSGGGVFMLQNGLWRLAGINYGVDDLYTAPDPATRFIAAIFDARGYYQLNDDQTTFTQIPADAPRPVPTQFYATEIAGRLPWILDTIRVADAAALPTESFGDWRQAYFSPAQIADATTGGPDADPDRDGVSNLLEFAFNLDPAYAEPVTMTAGTGLRGLPLVGVATVGTGDRRLTVEFVRRTAASGSGITYATQFTTRLEPALANWQAVGTESVTPINGRWERVRVTDAVPLGGTGAARFARVVVRMTNDE